MKFQASVARSTFLSVKIALAWLHNVLKFISTGTFIIISKSSLDFFSQDSKNEFIVLVSKDST
jgi:hypothetical protein